MAARISPTGKVVHRTARIRLRVTRRQAQRCYRLLRSAGDVWAWLLDTNRSRVQQGDRPLTNYQALCRELARLDGFGELSTVGARSVLRRYSDAWFQTAKRRNQAQVAGFPRRKRSLIRSATTTARSRSWDNGYGCQSRRAVRSCGYGWPVPFPTPPRRSGRSHYSPKGADFGSQLPRLSPSTRTT
jgi:hypothetical protein